MSYEDPTTVSSNSTYEQARAQSREQSLPDKIAWDPATSYRNKPYRLLQHQNGIVGYVHVRLIEGRDLRRSQQSFNDGQLNISKDQQQRSPVSAYALLLLSCCSSEDQEEESVFGPNSFEHLKMVGGEEFQYLKQRQPYTAADVPVSSRDSSQNQTFSSAGTTNRGTFRSSTVVESDNPVWPVSSTSSDPSSSSGRTSSFRISLRKGLVHPEGSTVMLNLQLQDDPQASSKARGALSLPSIPGLGGGGGGAGAGQHDLGRATVNLSSLLMGEEPVLDIWVDLRHRDTVSSVASSAARHGSAVASGSSTADSSARLSTNGRIRVLLSYEPEGLRPQINDYVTLEAFARQPTNLVIKPIAQPMKVVASRGEYLLLQYRCSSPSTRWSTSATSRRKFHQGRIRVHRNTVFVIERVSFVDGVVDTVLKPVDIIASAPLAQDVGRAISPYTGALGDLAMPAVLSGKIILAATKTAASAGITGLATTVKVLLMAAAAGKREDR